MRMINVLFRKGGHPAYDDILNYPPEGVAYHEATALRGGDSKKSFKHRVKEKIYATYLNLFNAPNAIPLDCKEDLIFSCGGILVKSRKPWVSDYEHAYALTGYRQGDAGVQAIKRKTIDLIEKSNCKILPWSNACRESFKNFFSQPTFQAVEDKIEVVYPAMHFEDRGKRESPVVPAFIYVSRDFYWKCGRETLAAFDAVSKKYDAKLYFVSNTPPEFKAKYASNKTIEFFESPIPREQVFELYRKSTAFVFPTLVDVFGLVLLEAMSFELPAIASNMFAIPEIIADNENGLLVEPEYTLYKKNFLRAFNETPAFLDFVKSHYQPVLEKQLSEKMIWVIENRARSQEMGGVGKRLVEKGRFSIKERNAKLKKIFEELID